MNQHCPNAIICDGVDSPLVNLSSEGQESQYWRAIGYCCNGAIKQYFSTISYDDALDGVQRMLLTSCPDCPPSVPDGTDRFFVCDALCADGSAMVSANSTLSQQDACFKAQELANQLPCPPVTPPTYFCNDTQICESINEDGTYTYIILPCTIYGDSTAEANAIALSRACERAKENRIRLGPITRCCCANEPYASTIKVTSDEVTLTYAVISGTVPPGISVGTGTTTNKAILVSGTPTTAGTYSFSIRAYDTSGNYSTRQYTIAVIEITTTSLPDFTVGTAYSAQLSATGGSGVYAWGIASGTLPDGLSLSATGLISGTPTNAAVGGTVVFRVVDTECEQMEESVIPPRVQLSASSTTRNMRWIGYDAFDGSKVRYKRIEWTGTSVQTAIALATMGVVAKARYEYSGVGEINAAGTQLSSYSKKLFVMPSDGRMFPYPWWVFGTGSTPPVEGLETLLGYCYPADPQSANDGDANNLTLVGDVGNNSSRDLPDSFYLGSANATVTPTTFTPSTTMLALDGLMGWTLTPSNYWANFKPLTPTAPTNFPTMALNAELGAWIHVTTQNNYSGVLSGEYTDAEAYANAALYTSNSTTAEYRPRNLSSSTSEDWFRASTTEVTYRLHFTNLIVGRSYTAQVSLICSNGTVTKPTWTFTATADTHDIYASIPTPPAYQTTMVRYPKVAFE